MPLRMVLGKDSYAILGPGLSYSVYAMMSGVFTYYVPAHNPRESVYDVCIGQTGSGKSFTMEGGVSG